MSTSDIDRRDFVVTGLAAGAAVGVLAATSGCSQATSMQVAAAVAFLMVLYLASSTRDRPA